MSNLSEQRATAARELFALGFDFEQIGERMSLSPVTVRKYCDEEFRQEIEGKDRARYEAKKAEREAEKAKKETRLRRLFVAEAKKAQCNLGDEEPLLFGLWKEQRKKRRKRK